MKPPRLVRTLDQGRLVLDSQELPDQRQAFLNDMLLGLSAQPKRIPPKYFYDAEGSRLFERITETPEYYVTRTEAALLEAHGEEILRLAGGWPMLVELGSGSSTKTRLLLDRLAALGHPIEYVPIDVSHTALADFGQRLLADYPTLQIQGLVCDYREALALLRERRERPKLFLFLGSSLGNYDAVDARELLTLVRAAMTPQDSFLLGLDCKKDPAVLHAAYNDAQGVTAAFNLNLLSRVNRELGGHFNVERFRHVAFYNAAQSRIEMHLESLDSQIVPVDAARRSFRFSRGERIHTENSYKYALEDLRALLAGTGLRLRCQWSDPAGWFSLNLLAAGQPYLESP